MTTRPELDAQARALGINPDEYSRKAELTAAIEDVQQASSRTPVRSGPVVLRPIMHAGEVIDEGEAVPDDLSPEAVQVLVEQGYVTG